MILLIDWKNGIIEARHTVCDSKTLEQVAEGELTAVRVTRDEVKH